MEPARRALAWLVDASGERAADTERTGRRRGEILEGKEGFRGILIPLPDGRTPPAPSFRLERQK